MIEIAQNLYIFAKDVRTARIFDKDGVIKIRLGMDTVNIAEREQFSGKLDNIEQAKAMVQRISDQRD